MRRIAVVADSYQEARTFAQTRAIKGDRVSLVCPTTHPGAIAGIKFDKVFRTESLPLDPRTEAFLVEVSRG